MSRQSPAEGRHQPCVREAESYETEQRRTERNNGWYQKGGWAVKIDKSRGCATVLSPGRMDSKVLVSRAGSRRFCYCKTGPPLGSRNLPRRFYCFMGRGMVNLRSLLGGVITLRFSLQPEERERSEKLQLFLGNLYY